MLSECPSSIVSRQEAVKRGRHQYENKGGFLKLKRDRVPGSGMWGKHENGTEVLLGFVKMVHR